MTVRILIGDCRARLAELPAESVHCCVTSPPYFGLRDYGVAGQIGLEPSPEEFVVDLVEVFRAVRRVLRNDGTLWLVIGDSYNADGRKGRAHMGVGKNSAYSTWSNRTGFDSKPKDLLGIPWSVAFALRSDGWWLRSDIIWAKPNPMPESVTDRPTSAHEHVFLLAKSERYAYDAEAVKELATSSLDDGRRGDGAGYAFKPTAPATHMGVSADGKRNLRNVWEVEEDEYAQFLAWKAARAGDRSNVFTVATQPFKESHFATFPPALIEPCIKAGCPRGGTVLDPFFGAGTTGLVADRLGRDCIGIELNPEYAAIAERRIRGDAGLFAKVDAA